MFLSDKELKNIEKNGVEFMEGHIYKQRSTFSFQTTKDYIRMDFDVYFNDNFIFIRPEITFNTYNDDDEDGLHLLHTIVSELTSIFKEKEDFRLLFITGQLSITTQKTKISYLKSDYKVTTKIKEYFQHHWLSSFFYLLYFIMCIRIGIFLLHDVIIIFESDREKYYNSIWAISWYLGGWPVGGLLLFGLFNLPSHLQSKEEKWIRSTQNLFFIIKNIFKRGANL